eukprot:gene9161-11763_t
MKPPATLVNSLFKPFEVPSTAEDQGRASGAAKLSGVRERDNANADGPECVDVAGEDDEESVPMEEELQMGGPREEVRAEQSSRFLFERAGAATAKSRELRAGCGENEESDVARPSHSRDHSQDLKADMEMEGEVASQAVPGEGAPAMKPTEDPPTPTTGARVKTRAFNFGSSSSRPLPTGPRRRANRRRAALEQMSSVDSLSNLKPPPPPSDLHSGKRNEEEPGRRFFPSTGAAPSGLGSHCFSPSGDPTAKAGAATPGSSMSTTDYPQ